VDAGEVTDDQQDRDQAGGEGAEAGGRQPLLFNRNTRLAAPQRLLRQRRVRGGRRRTAHCACLALSRSMPSEWGEISPASTRRKATHASAPLKPEPRASPRPAP